MPTSPIYAYFNNLLVLSLDTTNSSLLAGAVNEDELFVHFVGKNHIDYPTATITFKRSDGTISPELVMQQTNFVYSGTTFPAGTYSNSYNFLFYDDWILALKGPLEATVRLYGQNGNILVSGKLTLSVQPSVFSPETTITPAQYTNLVAQINSLSTNDNAVKIILPNCRNDDSVSLTIGMPVYASGSIGATGKIKIRRASALSTESQSNKLFGVVADNSIATNAEGNVLILGELQGVNTNSAEIIEGQPIFVSTTAGQLTSTAPTAPNHRIVVGGTIRKSNNGIIYVKQQLGLDVAELCDVQITSVQNGQILRYNSSNLRWENTNDLTTAETDIDALEVRMTTEEANVDNLQGRMTTAELDISNIEDGTTIVTKALGDQNGNTINTTYLTIADSVSTYVPLSSKGVINGVAPLDSSNKIPSIHLPGGVDDIKEFADLASFPAVGEGSIIYVALNTNIIYRWSGTAYVEISASLALGTTSSTAFPGDRGIGIINGTETLINTRITNSAIGATPAVQVVPLIVNAVASTTANLQEWQKNGQINAYVGTNGSFHTAIGIANASSSNSSAINLASNGTIITRQVNDATNINPSLTVNQQLGAGDITRFQFGGANKLEITKDGFLNQNGTRLFHQTGGNTNTFFGNSSGNLTLTGTNNTGFGDRTLNVLTSGGANTGVGFVSLFSLTTGANNTAIGLSSGRTITTGSNNTFVGTNAGYTDGGRTQLATATNSTALGFEAYTDANNQMVFGNDEVTEFKFNRNASAVLIAPRINASSASLHSIETTTTATSASMLVNKFLATTSNNMGDGFGSLISFQIRDNGNLDNTLANFGAVRSGADNSGRFVISTANAGSQTEKMTILPNGNVGIGTTAPAQIFSVVSTSNTQGVQIRRNSNTASDFATLGFRTDASEGINYAEIRSIRTNRVSGGDTELGFFTSAAFGGVTERLRITEQGLVGINETSPSAQLVVKSGATDRIPLIVDSLSTHNTNIAEFRVGGVSSPRAYIDVNGHYWTNQGIINLTNTNNARVGVGTNGPVISRDVADDKNALIVNLANASSTGKIVSFQSAGVEKSFIDKNGNFSHLVKTFKSSATINGTGTTAATVITLSLEANSNYEININGMWSKSYGGGLTFGTVVSIGVDNTTGTPTWNGVYEWATSPSATSLTIESESSNITTSTTAHGWTTGTGTSSISASFFRINGRIFTGTSAKILTLYVAKSADQTGNASISSCSATATKL
jgi:hypothetical protein